MSAATMPARPSLKELGERLDLLHAAAQRYPGAPAAFLAEVLGALLNRISTEDLKWAIAVGNRTVLIVEKLKQETGA